MNSVLVFVFALFVAAQATTSIVNGGFEDNSCTANTWCEYGGGNPFNGWTVGSVGNIDLHYSTPCCGSYTAHSGSWSIDLNGNTEGSVSQTITTTHEFQYVLSFRMASNPNCGPRYRTMTVTSNGGNAQSFSFDSWGTSTANPGWVQQSYTFYASSSSTTLNFQSTTPDTTCGPTLDDFSIAENNVAAICSQYTFNTQGYFCSGDASGFYQCLSGPWAPLSAFQNCGAGTTCVCSVGVECSNGGTTSPCQ